jgi:NADPH:quinone reductase-like Zn-dependent oxidoreductase
LRNIFCSLLSAIEEDAYWMGTSRRLLPVTIVVLTFLITPSAWQVLIETAKLSARQTVLIHGGSGGVGHLAIQIAKALGAKVIATASTANQDFIKRMGPM